MLVAEKFEPAAVKRVAARFGGEIHHTAVEAAELGGRAVALDLELLDGVDDRVERHLARFRLQHRNAVEEILVGARPSAVDAGQDGIRRQGDARSDGGEHDEQAAVQRQLHDLFMLDDRPKAGGFGAHDRRVADDRHLFSNVSDADLEIDTRLFTGRQADALAAHRLEARQLEIEAVFARRQARGGVDTFARWKRQLAADWSVFP